MHAHTPCANAHTLVKLPSRWSQWLIAPVQADQTDISSG